MTGAKDSLELTAVKNIVASWKEEPDAWEIIPVAGMNLVVHNKQQCIAVTESGGYVEPVDRKYCISVGPVPVEERNREYVQSVREPRSRALLIDGLLAWHEKASGSSLSEVIERLEQRPVVLGEVARRLEKQGEGADAKQV